MLRSQVDLPNLPAPAELAERQVLEERARRKAAAARINAAKEEACNQRQRERNQANLTFMRRTSRRRPAAVYGVNQARRVGVLERGAKFVGHALLTVVVVALALWVSA